MGSQLQKLQLTFDRHEDRLVLIFFTTDFSEYRFWITRRMVIQFWQVLKKLEEILLKSDVEKQEETKKASSHIQHEATQAAATKYATSVTKQPLGDRPLLLYKLQAKALENGRAFFHLEDIEGKNIEFSGDKQVLAGLIQLIAKTIPQTEWGIELK